MSSKRPSADSPLRSALKSPDKPAKKQREQAAEFDIGSPAPVPGPVTGQVKPNLPGDGTDFEDFKAWATKKIIDVTQELHAFQSDVMERSNAQDKANEEFNAKFCALAPPLPHNGTL